MHSELQQHVVVTNNPLVTISQIRWCACVYSGSTLDLLQVPAADSGSSGAASGPPSDTENDDDDVDVVDDDDDDL